MSSLKVSRCPRPVGLFHLLRAVYSGGAGTNVSVTGNIVQSKFRRHCDGTWPYSVTGVTPMRVVCCGFVSRQMCMPAVKRSNDGSTQDSWTVCDSVIDVDVL
eukprot:GFYU01032230.1.p1 GENE.GFYU01032230.1~~GFYU01032230.1.p1  ORF type:complete len:102 (-),score=7.39 GFYU01032230.1:56-361(-)